MARWCWKRWVGAWVVGSTTTLGLARAQQGGTEAPPAVPKVGDVISLKFRDGPERQVKVLKTERQADGSYLSEVKDLKTGETFTLLDRPGNVPPPGANPGLPAGSRPTPPTPPPAGSPSSSPAANKPRTSEGLLPALSSVFKNPFSSGKTDEATARPPAPASAPSGGMEPAAERPGLLKRWFGRKSGSTPTTVPAATSHRGVTSSPDGSSSGLPPAVRPAPTPGATPEPPRARPPQAVVPPRPTVPAPNPSSPAVPAPLPLPLPLPAPADPGPRGVPPAADGLPSIPLPPGGSAATPASPLPASGMVLPVAGAVGTTTGSSRVPVEVAALVQDIQPYVTALQTDISPGQRVLAARALAGCRHASSDTVKTVLHIAARNDPNPAVRACCLDELARLGYRDPAFLKLLREAVQDPSAEVAAAARHALARLQGAQP